MKIRSVIFDMYKCVLEVGPPPIDAEAKWQSLARARLGPGTWQSLAEFTAACDCIIAREHGIARARGIPHPEIYWPDIALGALPELALVTSAERDDFLFQQQTLFRAVRLMRGAEDVLRSVRELGVLIGLASNAQPYTLRELDRALEGSGVSRGDFTPALCFWSFEHGFSKPDPHVFRLLRARLRLCGVWPRETLMVGDRLDNDIEPARAQGWQTWQLKAAANGDDGGDWSQLAAFLREHM
jgi:putative hydrolase of the HAD superfamily